MPSKMVGLSGAPSSRGITARWRYVASNALAHPARRGGVGAGGTRSESAVARIRMAHVVANGRRTRVLVVVPAVNRKVR